jgi:hypothetical protein
MNQTIKGKHYVFKNTIFCDTTKYNLVKFTEASRELTVSIFGDAE